MTTSVHIAIGSFQGQRTILGIFDNPDAAQQHAARFAHNPNYDYTTVEQYAVFNEPVENGWPQKPIGEPVPPEPLGNPAEEHT